jgi:DNA replication licensing factor MCM2
VDPIVDEALAEFVVGSHMNSHPHSERRETTHNNKVPAPRRRPRSPPPPASASIAELVAGSRPQNEDGFALSQELLRKYITYARSRCHPKLRNIDRDKVENLYAQLRTESLVPPPQ